MRIDITEYRLEKNISREITVAVVADLHNKPHFGRVVDILKNVKPDIITVPGDLLELNEKNNGIEFLRRASKIAPLFYTPGNHERLTDKDIPVIKDTGTVFLDNDYAKFEDIIVGGLSSGCTDGGHHNEKTPPPDLEWLDNFSNLDGTKILLSHHPEYYPEYIKDKNIDVVISGHAHGGQWRVFGQGIYAPGQGIFPKYTAGVHDGTLVVSRGLANHTVVPRIFNRPELVLIKLVPKITEARSMK